MTYLLTEVAMEMLGWRYYDEDGVARPMNFDGVDNGVLEGVENLATLIGATQLNKPNASIPTSVVKAEADSSSNVAHQTSDVIDLDASDDGAAGFSAQNIGNNNELYTSSPPALDTSTVQYTLQAQDPLATTDSNITNAISAPFDLKIEHVQGGYDISSEEEVPSESIQQPQFSIVKVTSAGNDIQSKSELKSINQAPTSIETTTNTDLLQQYNLPNISAKHQKNLSAFIDLTDDSRSNLEIGQQLNHEIDKIASDLNRHKSTFFEAIPDVLKHPLPAYQSVLKSYREQEYKNLEKELENLQTLCIEAEQKSYNDFGQTYPKYLNICKKLNAQKQKQQTTFSNGTLDNIESIRNALGPNNAKGRKQVARKKTSLKPH